MQLNRIKSMIVVDGFYLISWKLGGFFSMFRYPLVFLHARRTQVMTCVCPSSSGLSPMFRMFGNLCVFMMCRKST